MKVMDNSKISLSTHAESKFDDRMNSIKGQKDRLDITGLAFYSNIDYSRLKTLLNKYEKPSYIDLYVNAIAHIEKRLLPFLNLNESTYAKMKKKTLEKIIPKSV